jgi:hypothetical protein
VRTLAPIPEGQQSIRAILVSPRAKRQQRDETINELRVAWFLDSLGYPVADWEPTDAPHFNGEFSVHTGFGRTAEVKSPGWESELTDVESKAGRTQQPKYIGIEGRAARPVQIIQRTVEKARPKFTGKWPSMVVITDDCFVNLGNWGWGPLQMALTQDSFAWGRGLFRQSEYSNISAVALFWLGNGAQYRSICTANPNALSTAMLPADLISKFIRSPMEPSLHAPQQGTHVVP